MNGCDSSLSLQVLVKDHLGEPVSGVPVRLVERQLFRQGREKEDMPCPERANSQANGLAVFICNTPSEGIRAVLKVRKRRRGRGRRRVFFLLFLFPPCFFSQHLYSHHVGCWCHCLLLLIQFETADPALPAPSQASLSLNVVAYHSPNQRYLYIDHMFSDHSLEVGQYANFKVYSATPTYVPIRALSYLVRRHSW